MTAIVLIRQISRATGRAPEQVALFLQALLDQPLGPIEEPTLDESQAICPGSRALNPEHRDVMRRKIIESISEAVSLPRLAHALATQTIDDSLPVSFSIHHPNRPLVFIHISKTAGTSFFNFLHTHYASPQYIAPQFTGDYKNIRADDPKVLLYWGHFFFKPMAILVPNGVFCTFLRHPVDRVISHYHSWRETTNLTEAWIQVLPKHELEAVRAVQNMSLEQFIESENISIRTQAANFQTAMLSNHGSPSHPYFLSSAKENIFTRFLYVGIVEEFRRSIKLFRAMVSSNRTYKLTTSQENRSNVSSSRVAKRIRKRIEEFNAFDMELYECGREIFRENCRQYLPHGRGHSAGRTHG